MRAHDRLRSGFGSRYTTDQISFEGNEGFARKKFAVTYIHLAFIFRAIRNKEMDCDIFWVLEAYHAGLKCCTNAR